MKKSELIKNSFICSAILLIIMIVYSQILSYDFINFDDPDYVTDNKIVQKGITIEGIKWAFSFVDNDLTYWHPLAYISHMIDCQLFGINPGMHHISSVLLHSINSILLYFTLIYITAKNRQSFIVAMLFAVHPIAVDSVVWIAQRKTLLVTFFCLLTILSYSFYIKKGGLTKYLLVCFFIIAGLMSKPLMVTIPFILLVLDFWPYKRVKKNSFKKIVFEKIPPLILACLWGLTIFIPKHVLDKNISFADVSLLLRVENAIVSYLVYIREFFIPKDLVIINPYPVMVPFTKAFMAFILLCIITIAAISFIKKAPYILAGWSVFIITLIPFTGLVQGAVWPAHADRFAYLPFIGLYIIFAWGSIDFIEKYKINKKLYLSAGLIILASLMTLTFNQVKYWKNSIVVYQHAIENTEKNYVAYNNLGTAYQQAGKTDDALKQFYLALWAKPGYSKANHNIAIAFIRQGKFEGAITHFLLSLKSNPFNYVADYNLGNLYEKQGRYEEAIKFYEKAIEHEPGFADAYNNIGVILQNKGKKKEAVRYFKRAFELNPENINTLCHLANILYDYGKISEAVIIFKQALQIDSQNIFALNGLAVSYIMLEKYFEAEQNIREILNIEPSNKAALNNLQLVGILKQNIQDDYKRLEDSLVKIQSDFEAKAKLLYALGKNCEKLGRYDEAKALYLKAISLFPAHIDCLKSLAKIYEEKGDYTSAVVFYKKIAENSSTQKTDAFYNIAGVFAFILNSNESIKWLAKAVDEGFHDWRILKSDHRFDNIRKSDAFVEFMDIAMDKRI